MRYTPSFPVGRVLLGAVASLGFLAIALGALEPGAVARPPQVKPPSERIVLFDGKSLDGWEGDPKYWSVVDGVIVGKNSARVPVSTYLLTKKKFDDFRMTAKVKLVKSEMHSGIAFWGRVAPEKGDPFTYMGHLVMFPSGWGMYDLHRRGGFKEVDGAPAKKVGKQHDWNDLEILARGQKVRVAVNGTAVVDFTDPKTELVAEGPIGLQLHSNDVPQEVHFKDLVLDTYPLDDRLLTVK